MSDKERDSAPLRGRSPYDPPELRDLIPGLTKPSITDAEQRQLYEAAMRGEHPPSHRPWDFVSGSAYLMVHCPGCGHEQHTAFRSKVTCDGCGVTRRVP